MTEKTTSKTAPKGTVAIDFERCKGCGLCVAACPRRSLALSQRLNAKGYSPAELSMPESCTGCGLCAAMCPDTALRVYRRKEKERAGGSHA